jgi:hypothetical protein
VLTNNGRLFTIARRAGTANWMRCSNNLPDVLAAADCLEYFFQNDIKNNYDVGFVVCDNNMFVATFKHKTLPVTAWVPLIYFTSSIDLRFRLNGNNYQVTGFGDREKPYKYDELKGEQEMEANLTSLADLSKQLGLKENLNNVAAPATASIIPAAVVETVTPVVEQINETISVITTDLTLNETEKIEIENENETDLYEQEEDNNTTEVSQTTLLLNKDEQPQQSKGSYFLGMLIIISFIALILLGTQYDKLKTKMNFNTEGLKDYLLLDERNQPRIDDYPSIRDI